VKKATKEESAATKEILEIFQKAAGTDQELGWPQLKKVLDSYLEKGMKYELIEHICVRIHMSGKFHHM